MIHVLSTGNSENSDIDPNKYESKEKRYKEKKTKKKQLTFVHTLIRWSESSCVETGPSRHYTTCHVKTVYIIHNTCTISRIYKLHYTIYTEISLFILQHTDPINLLFFYNHNLTDSLNITWLNVQYICTVPTGTYLYHMYKGIILC